MKNSEEAIEKVLTGLRDVDAAAGMERRILDGLEERAARPLVRSQWFGLGWRGVPLSYVACGVALGVVAVVLAVPAVRRFGHAPVQAKIDVAPVKTIPAVSSRVAAVVPEPALRGQGGGPMAARGMGLVRVAGSVADSAVDSEDSVAMSEMRAPSLPAPPMPLTEQERLLLRMAHKNDPVELAMLDPKLRELEDAQEKAEFQMFFARPVMKQPADEDQAQPTQPVAEQKQPDQEVPAPSQVKSPDLSQSTAQQEMPR